MKLTSSAQDIYNQIDPDSTKLGDLRKMAKTIKKDHDLAIELWSTQEVLPCQLAILIMDKKLLDEAVVDQLLDDIQQHEMEDRLLLADWLMANQLMKDKKLIASIYTWEDDLKNLKVPMFVINGDEDEPCLEPGLFLKRTVPSAGLAVVPQTGHAVNIEEPMAFNQLVAEFLSLVELGTWLPRDYGSGDAW